MPERLFTTTTSSSCNSSSSTSIHSTKLDTTFTTRILRDDMNTPPHQLLRPKLIWSSSFRSSILRTTSSDTTLSSSKRPAPTESEGHVLPPPSKIARNMSYPTVERYHCPENFAIVTASVYRSSFPRLENFSYLKKLELKTILTLVPEPYPEENIRFMQENGIRHVQIAMPGNNKGKPSADTPVPDELITAALRVVLDKANHPILIHCNKGKHRTGCVIGCLRRFQAWSAPLAVDEYRRFAGIKSRPRDMLKIENYGLESCWDAAKENGWIPATTRDFVIEDQEEDIDSPLAVAGPAAIKAQ